ncbi:hypothetical protein [Cohnella yongneupensis]|uniref:Phage tail tape measure protein n=1 Tax=Cohnella yongneupensis TaxID=425006 RepID=A0ABW0QUN1_9BACL
MVAEVGSIKARMELDARGFNLELLKAKQSLTASASEAQKVNKDFKQITRSLLDLGMSGKEIRKVQQEFRQMRPDVVNQQVQQLEIKLRRLGATSDQIARIKSKMVEVQEETKRTESRMNTLHGALIAVGSIAAISGLVNMIKGLAAEANKTAMAYQGLTAISKSLNLNVEETTGLAQELADKGFMSLAESTEAVKTALATGLSIEEARKLITSLGDAAAYNRQANYGWGESIVVTLQGIKQGNSTLTDAVGVTTNLSQMYDRYAASIGTTAGKLTDAQKVQAAYNGFISDSALYAGNADQAMEGYAGSQAHFNQSMQTARAELGEAFLPVLQQLMDTIVPIISGFAEWAKNNKEVIAGVAAAAVTLGALILGATTLASVITTLSAAFAALNLSLGPIGWAITAIAAVTIGVTAYKAAADAASHSVSEFAKNQKDLNAALNDSPVKISADQYQKLSDNINILNEVLERRKKLQDEYDRREKDAHEGRGSIENTQALFDLADSIKAVDKELRGMDYSSVREAEASLLKMRDASKGALGAVVDLQRASMSETIAHADNVKEIRGLIDEYETLSKSANKTEEQKSRLEAVVKALKKEYPDLITQLDQENVWHLKNVDALKDYVNGEEARVKAASKASIETLTIAQTEAKERARLAQETINAIEEIEGGKKKSNLPNFGKMMPLAGSDPLTDSLIKKEKEKLQTEINDSNFAINEAKKLIEDMSTENWDEFRPKPSAVSPEVKKDKPKTLAEIQQEQYQASLKLNEYKKDMGRMNEQQELDELNRLKKKYESNADIRMDLEVKIHKLEELMAQEKKDLQEKSANASFKFSQEWIEQEERRMTLAGKSEEEIAQMKLEAWTRVRNRYAKDSDLYKQADTQIYQARISLIRETEQAQNSLANSLEQGYSKKLTAALKSAETELKHTLDGIDNKIKTVNTAAEQSVNSLRDAIEGVNEELQRELDIYEAQINALEQAKQQDDRAQAESEHNNRLKALEDQKTWLNENGNADPFEIAALNRQVSDEQQAWADQQKQWSFDDERQRLEGLKTAAQDRAEVRRNELENQISAIEKSKAIQVAALDDEKERLQDHWNNEETGVRAIMENGLIDTIADMAAHDEGFRERGELMMESLINGIASKKESLEAELASIQSLIGFSDTSMPSTIQAPKTGTPNVASRDAAIAAAANSPKSITLYNQMDGKTISKEVINLVGNEILQPIRAK